LAHPAAAGQHLRAEVLVESEADPVQLLGRQRVCQRLHRPTHGRQVLAERLFHVGMGRARRRRLVMVERVVAALLLDHGHIAAEQVHRLPQVWLRRVPQAAVLALLLEPDRTSLDPGARPGDSAAQRDCCIRVMPQALGDDRGPERQHWGTVDPDLAALVRHSALFIRLLAGHNAGADVQLLLLCLKMEAAGSRRVCVRVISSSPGGKAVIYSRMVRPAATRAFRSTKRRCIYLGSGLPNQHCLWRCLVGTSLRSGVSGRELCRDPQIINQPNSTKKCTCTPSSAAHEAFSQGAPTIARVTGHHDQA
jgi:hypothetical protein